MCLLQHYLPIREHLERHVRHACDHALAPLQRRDPPQQPRLDVEVVSDQRGWQRIGLAMLLVWVYHQ
jgi:hypothetical protein